jgi:hypothetical protein
VNDTIAIKIREPLALAVYFIFVSDVHFNRTYKPIKEKITATKGTGKYRAAGNGTIINENIVPMLIHNTFNSICIT